MQQRLFGASSEKRKPAVEATPPASARKQRGHGPRAQPQLAVQEVVLPLDEADKVCGLCGGALKEWAGQTEDSQEVRVVERHFVWAHVRRKFVEAERVAPVCAEVLSLIVQMYAIEADLPQPHVLQGEQQAAALAQRLAVRQEKSAPLVAAIREWALAQRSLPGSALRKALEYMLELWSGLTVFLSD
ncbi:transposase [Myxococcus sp. AM011]|uniref:IS66 family transposase n=1 Tax=Myxococcus sp. AM011 TaxID=2745200 RepID=UPI001595DE3D|nr:transposase [Myxococcus sp. AM011]NVJ20228.1 transposase [Myxococcus sp. AM011]